MCIRDSPRITSGRVLSVELVGLPSRSRVPSTVTLILAIGILGFGVWGASFQPEVTASSLRRKTREARKEKLLTDLVKVERQHRVGKIGSTKRTTRRSELFVAIEKVYRELDEELGLQVAAEQLQLLHHYVWRTAIETEHVRTFATVHEGPFVLHPEEIGEGRFWTLPQLRGAVGGAELTPNLEHELSLLGLYD